MSIHSAITVRRFLAPTRAAARNDVFPKERSTELRGRKANPPWSGYWEVALESDQHRQSFYESAASRQSGGPHLKGFLLEFQRDFCFAEIEFRCFGLLAISENGLEELLALVVICVLRPHEFCGLTSLDSFSDVEKAVFFAIFRNENFGNRLLGVVRDLELVLLGLRYDRGEGERDSDYGTSDAVQ